MYVIVGETVASIWALWLFPFPAGWPDCRLGPGDQNVQKKGDKGPLDMEAVDESRMRCVVKMERQVSVGGFCWCDGAGGLQGSGGFRDKHKGRCTSQRHGPEHLLPRRPKGAQASPAASAVIFFNIWIFPSLPRATSDTKWPAFSMGNRNQQRKNLYSY